MARYKLTAAAVIDDIRYDVGSEIEYDGVPGPHMEPLDAPAKRAVAERDKAAASDEPAPPAEEPPPPPPAEPDPKPEEKKDEDRAGPGGHRRG